MSISRARLDRFISEKCQINRKKVRLLLAQKRVVVDGIIATDIGQPIDKFSVISLDNKIIQQNVALYIMLHKPVGVVCATKDDKHKTVIEVRGCFWHRHQGCKDASTPKTNTEFWETKFLNTVNRDKNNIEQLKKLGWNTIVVWECETANINKLTNKLTSALNLYS